jgi:transcriptional regulator with XRE-family HTH domain
VFFRHPREPENLQAFYVSEIGIRRFRLRSEQKGRPQVRGEWKTGTGDSPADAWQMRPTIYRPPSFLLFHNLLEVIDLSLPTLQSSARLSSFALDRQPTKENVMPRLNPPSRRTQYFSNTLLLLMERNGINQVQLSAATGIAVSRINNYLHGKYRTIRPDHLALIAKATGRTAEESGVLVRAYLLDLLPEVLQPVVHIDAVGTRKSQRRQDQFEQRELPATAAAALARLRALSLRNAKARARLLWFAEIMQEVHGR